MKKSVMNIEVFGLGLEPDFEGGVYNRFCLRIILILCPLIMTDIDWLNIILLTVVTFAVVNEVTIVKSRCVDW